MFPNLLKIQDNGKNKLFITTITATVCDMGVKMRVISANKLPPKKCWDQLFYCIFSFLHVSVTTW